jgi:hypothetical protein
MKTLTSPEMKTVDDVWFDHVMAEYELLPHHQTETYADPAALRKRIDTIVEKYRSSPSLLTKADIYELEKYILDNQEPQVIQLRAPGLRENYREIAGERAYENYLQSKPLKGRDATSTQVLRADLGRLLDFLHWAYSMIPKREQLRAAILKRIGVVVLIFIALVGVCIYSLNHVTREPHPIAATLLVVMIMGALGGFVSLQQRIQTIPADGDPILSILQLQSGKFSLYLAPVSGGIFALVMFYMFQGNIISGTLFPS